MTESVAVIVKYLEAHVNSPGFHFQDIADMMTARKERIWIKEPPKSRCTEKCKVKSPLEFLREAIATETDECILWPFAKGRGGYGIINYQGKTLHAHRLVVKLTDPNFKDSLHALHNCDVRPCINKRHLFSGTNADNVADRMAKGRHRVAFGENHGNAKLTNEQVIEIRRLYASGVRQSVISQNFSIGFRKVSDIVTRKSWRHIE